jgi:hypothetical protein
MASELIMKPRLVGRRFDGGVVPLEFLADFTVLGEMILEVARWKYFTANSERKRLPRGFNDGLSLKLTAIEEGSAILGITLFFASLFPTNAAQCILDARDAILGAISAAERNEPVEDFLPPGLLSYFDRFGRNLAEEESINFLPVGSSAPATLTKRSRKILVLAGAEEITNPIVVYGNVFGVNRKTEFFQMQLIDGTSVPVPCERRHRDAILDALNNYRGKDHSPRVRVSGTGRFNRDNKLLGVESVEHFSVVDPLDVGARVEELKLLKPGWLDGQGNRLDPLGLDWLSKAFYEFYPQVLGFPYLYPTVEGNARFEWSVGPYSISLDVDLNARTGEWHSLDLETDAETTREALDLSSQSAWEWVAREIRQLTGVSPE